MKFNFTRFALWLTLITGAISTSYAQFTLDGQYRPRAEFRNGFKTPIAPNQDPAAFVEHRARLTAGYKKEKLGFKLSIQDVRIWGETGQINKTDGLLSVHEVYGDYYASGVSTFRIGRQELSYDGDRFIGTLNWAQQARAFDAIRYMYNNDSTGFSFDIAVTWNQDGQAVDGAPEPTNLTGTLYTTGKVVNGSTIFNLALPKSQQILYVKKEFGDHDLGLMAVNEIRESWQQNVNGDAEVIGGPFSQFHLGLTPNFNFGDLKVGGQAYYSGGTFSRFDIGNGVEEVSLAGYMFNLNIQHKGLPGKPLLGFDYISGDDASTTDKVEGWAPLYGTNHKWYGHMDYFYVGNGHGGVDNQSAGLMDIYLQTTFKTSEKGKFQANLHYFMSNQDRTDANGDQFSGGLGTEIDLSYTHKISNDISFKAGYSQMFGITETMKVLKGLDKNASIQDMQNWAFIMIDFTPQFLNK